GLGVLSLVLAMAFVQLRRRGERPASAAWALLLLPLSGLGAGFVAQALAYRLYLPQRMLQLAWLPVFLLALPLSLEHVLRRRGTLGAALGTCAILFTCSGDGLAIAENLTDFNPKWTPVMRGLATLPADALVAAHPERGSYVQLFAHRRTLVSAS